MCNYPEESSRPLSTMECQNAFDQLISETEQSNAVDNYSPDPERIIEIRNQYKLFEKSLTPQQVADMELEKLCEDHDKWLDEEDAKAKKASEMEQPKAVDNSSPDAANSTDIANQYKQFAKSLTPQQIADIYHDRWDRWLGDEAAKAKKASEIDTLEKAADESGIDMTDMLNDMREAAGLSTEDEENIPTLTKETIDAATEAFLDEEDVDEVNEAACTDLCEEDAPDEGIDPNPVKTAFHQVCDEIVSKVECACGKPDCEGNRTKCLYDEPKLGSDEWTAKTALKYLQHRQVGQNNLDAPESQSIIDDVYSHLNEQQRLLMIGLAPWIESAFKDATTREINRKREQELEAAEEDSKRAAEKLTAKMEGKTGDWKADRQKAAHDAWNEFYEKWDRLPKDIQDTLAKVPDFMLSLNMYREEMTTKRMEAMTDYDPEKTVNDLSKAHEQGNLSAAEAAKMMNEPNMINNFMWNNPEFNQWNHERCYYNSDNCFKLNQQFEDLQKKGVIPPTNNGQPFFPKDQYNKPWFHDPSADLGNTMIYGMKPSLFDTVKDGNGAGKGDCTVADVWEQDVARVQEVNKSFKITPEKKPLTPEESLAELMNDMPKSMVDKIMSIPNDDWKYTFDGGDFELSYAVASRRIRLIMSKRNLSATEHVGAVFSVEYINDGPGSVRYMRGFNTLKDITDTGKNAKRLYQWYGKVLAAFFGK